MTVLQFCGMTLKIGNVDDLLLQVNPFNPKKRVLGNKLAPLVKSIKESGGVLTPVMVGRDNVIGDGHRRVAAAKIAGIEQVPVLHNKWKTGAEIFRTTNNDKVVMKMDASQYLQTYVLSGFLMDLIPPGSTAEEKINEAMSLVSRRTISDVMEHGKSATFVTQLNDVLGNLPLDHPLHSRNVNMDDAVTYMLLNPPEAESKAAMRSLVTLKNQGKISYSEFIKAIENSFKGMVQ